MKGDIGFFKGLLLLIVALILGVFLLPLGLIFSGVKRLFRSDLGRYLYWIAYSIDQLGNVICMDLFNVSMIKKESLHKFGDPDETISSVLGKNQRDGTLKKLGRLIVDILDWIDPNHSMDAIERFVKKR